MSKQVPPSSASGPSASRSSKDPLNEGLIDRWLAPLWDWAARASVWRGRGIRAFLASLTGLFLSLASPDVSWFAISFVAWIPLMLALRGQSPRAGALYGLVAGFFAVFIAYNWMAELTARFGGLPGYASWLVHVVFSLFHGLQWGFCAWLAVRLAGRVSWRVPWLMVLTWPILELFFPALFPVNGAFFWAQHPSWIQAAELAGAPGVGALHVLCNVVLLRVLLAAQPGEAGRRLVLAASVIAAIPSLGLWRMRALDQTLASQDKVNIGVVQGNAGIETRRDLRSQVLRSLQESTAKMQEAGADLVVWGETVYPFRGFFRDSITDHPSHDVRQVRRGFSVPLLFGLTSYDRGGDWRRPYNTAWILDGEGKFQERYDKAKPLWFGEYVPLVDPDWYLDTFPNASYLTKGPGPAVLRWNNLRLGPMICYEVLLSDYVRQTVDQDAQILVNMTNDSWFGATREQGEHFALTIVRAVETRRPLIRAVSAGISAYVDPAGRVVDSLPRTDSDRDGYKGAQGFLVEVPVPPADARTLYLWVGWGWKLVFPLAALALAFVLRRLDAGKDPV